MDTRHPLAVDVELALNPGEDSRAPGGEVTDDEAALAERLAQTFDGTH